MQGQAHNKKKTSRKGLSAHAAEYCVLKEFVEIAA